jgi:hypothetical protein
MSRHHHTVLAIVLASISAATTTNTASADPVVIKQMFHMLVAESPLEGKTLTSPTAPDVQVQLSDGGTRIGAGARTTVVYHRMRGSFGFGAFGIRGAEYEMDPQLPVTSATSAGAYFELAAGYEFRLGPVFPYADLRADFGFANLSMQVQTAQCGDQYQPLSAEFYFGLGPSAGLFVPVVGYFFVDVSGYAGVVGDRGAGVFGGMGFWIPSE